MVFNAPPMIRLLAFFVCFSFLGCDVPSSGDYETKDLRAFATVTNSNDGVHVRVHFTAQPLEGDKAAREYVELTGGDWTAVAHNDKLHQMSELTALEKSVTYQANIRAAAGDDLSVILKRTEADYDIGNIEVLPTSLLASNGNQVNWTPITNAQAKLTIAGECIETFESEYTPDQGGYVFPSSALAGAGCEVTVSLVQKLKVAAKNDVAFESSELSSKVISTLQFLL